LRGRDGEFAPRLQKKRRYASDRADRCDPPFTPARRPGSDSTPASGGGAPESRPMHREDTREDTSESSMIAPMKMFLGDPPLQTVVGEGKYNRRVGRTVSPPAQSLPARLEGEQPEHRQLGGGSPRSRKRLPRIHCPSSIPQHPPKGLRLGLAMVVKNEQDHIGPALSAIHDLFDDIAIVDTGSNDSTVELLARRFGVAAHAHIPQASNPTDILEARNIGMSLCRSPWVLVLDADERISRSDVVRLKTLMPGPDVDGYFIRWENHRFNTTFEDYKLCVVRNRPDFRYLGAAHQVPQSHLRLAGRIAAWCGDVTLHHYPNERRKEHRQRYLHQLQEGLHSEPGNTRYRWFLGYSLLKYGRIREGIRELQIAATANPAQFPVEYLNSNLVLTTMYARSGLGREADRALTRSMKLLADFTSDFEVAVNFRAAGWCRSALECLRAGTPRAIESYSFGF
jgi:glycosyltransferase involved in cell wall biosynthesis